jgi:type IV secretory pathway VirB4 component
MLPFLSKFLKKKDEVSLETYVDDQSTFLDILSPDSIEECDTYLRFGSNYVRTLAVAHFSNNVTAGFLEDLHSIGSNVSVIHHIEPTSSEQMIRSLDKAIIEYNSQLMDARLRTSERQIIENNIKDATILLDNLTSSNSELFNEHMLIHIQALSLEELDRITHTVKTITNRHLKAITPTNRMFDAFESVLPLNKNKVKELTYRNFDAEALSALFPFDENEVIAEKGIIKGRNLKTNSIVMVNHDELLNRHEYICGPSGSGKSTYLFGDMLRRWIQGVRIRVIDPKGEYGNKFKRIGGEWIKISPMLDTVINPFEIMNTKLIKNEDGNDIESSLLHRKISNLKTMFTLMYPNLKDDPVAKALLEKVLVQTYTETEKRISWDTDFSKLKSSDYPTMGDLYRLIERLIKDDENFKPLSGLYQVLYQYVEGSYSKAMNGHTNVDLSNDLITFDLFDLKGEEDLQKVAMYNILTFLEEDAVKDKEIVQIYVDEAHILADPRNPLAMKFLSDMYKLLRSFNSGVTSATQQVGDFLSAIEGTRNYGEAIILNSVSKLYLPMSKEELNTIMNKTSENFSEEEQQILIIKDADRKKSAGKGVYIVGSTKVALNVQLSPVELQLWDRGRLDSEYPHIKNNHDILLPEVMPEVNFTKDKKAVNQPELVLVNE